MSRARSETEIRSQVKNASRRVARKKREPNFHDDIMSGAVDPEFDAVDDRELHEFERPQASD